MTTLEKLEELVYHGFKETDRKFELAFQKIKEANQNTAKNIDNLGERIDNLTIDVDNLTIDVNNLTKDTVNLKKEVRGITGSMGRFAENMVEPSAIRLFAKHGIELQHVSQRVRGRNRWDLEIDVLGVGATVVMPIEVKFTLEVADVKEFLSNLTRFFKVFPLYEGLKLHAAVAGMNIVENADRFAYQQGLFVIAQSGDGVEILNDERFKPRCFNNPSLHDER